MEKRKIIIACVGDSITAGVGIADPYEDSYPIQLNCLLGSNVFDVISELGRSGAAVWRQSPLPYISTPQYNKAKSLCSDYLIICLGSNDTVNQITDTFRQEFKEDFDKLLAGLKENSPDAKTYICRIPPILGKENAPFAKAVPEINELIEEVADSSYASLIDLNTPFQLREDLFSDGLHPNEKGARLIAETIFNALKKDIS